MKLYFSPGACSLAPHILMQELGLSYTPVKVDLRTHKLADGSDYYAINAKGYVPLLELDDGARLTEVAAILQYLADRMPGTLVPAAGTFERYRQVEWLNFIATEIHKGFSPLWYPDTPEATRKQIVDKLGKRFDHVVETLKDRQFIAGDKFTAADAYLYTILSWAGMLKVDLSRWPTLARYLERIGARPAVREAKRIEAGGKIAAAA
jgi:glutathione S-transferase